MTQSFWSSHNNYAVLLDNSQDRTINSSNLYGTIIHSQPWFIVAAVYTIIIIQANSTEISLIAFVGIGMAEVLSYKLLVYKDQSVNLGQQIEMFYFGGSSYIVIFQENTKLRFTDKVVLEQHIYINRVIMGINQQIFVLQK